MSFAIKASREANDKLNEVAKNTEQLDDPSISLSEKFANGFINENSNFDSVDKLFAASGFKVDTEEDFEAIPDYEWNLFISDNTSFDNWDEMIDIAGTQYSQKLSDF